MSNIKATVIQDSKSLHSNRRIVTFELEFPRFILPEFNTHRNLSRNTSSSRAIPVTKMLDNIEENPAVPVSWGKNQAGMQAHEEVNEEKQKAARMRWFEGMDNAIEIAKLLSELGIHKQIVNRITEPFQMIKVITTATSFDNFFNLRCHEDAQPEIKELADKMLSAYKASIPVEISSNEWHVPYIERNRDENGVLQYFTLEDNISKQLSVKEAIEISCSCAAQVSYRKNDTSIEKAKRIYQKLVQADPVHASAFEHCATPIEYNINKGLMVMNSPTDWSSWENGITHVNRQANLCSGNFVDWVQYRQLIPNNAYWHYEK